MECKKCGAPLKKDAKFCTKCGTKVLDDSVSKGPPSFQSEKKETDKTRIVRKAPKKEEKKPKVHIKKIGGSNKKKTYGIVAGCTLVLVAIVTVTVMVILPYMHYKSAIQLYEDGKYEEAMESFKTMETYKDSKDYYYNSVYQLAVQYYENGDYESCIPLFNLVRFNEESQAYLQRAEMNCLKNASIGDTVYYGADEESYQWRVIANEDGDLLLLMEDNLKDGKYDLEASQTVWDDCSLREQLNNEFLDGFMASEQEQILTVNNTNISIYLKMNATYTDDKVFILSREEVQKYLKTEEERANGSPWWNRSPLAYCTDTEGKETGINAPFVDEDGSINENSYYNMNEEIGIRPAMWVNISGQEKTRHRTEEEIKEEKAKLEKEQEEKAKEEKAKEEKEKEFTFNGVTYTPGSYKISGLWGLYVYDSPSTNANKVSIPESNTYKINRSGNYIDIGGILNIVEFKKEDSEHLWGKTDFGDWVKIYDSDHDGTLMTKI